MNLETSKNFFKKIFLATIFFVAVNFSTALAVPALISPIENLAGRALSYEVLFRLYLAFAGALLLWFLTVAILWRPHPAIWRRGLIFLWCAFLALLIVFVFDERWSLTEEYSWIRYPTAAALFLAALFWSKRALRERANKALSFAYVLLSLGIVFAAADELFLLHERIGDGLQKIFHWPGFVTDLVTVFYGVIGLAVIVFIGRALNRFLSPAQKSFLLTVYLWGIFLFITATLFDTFDNQLFAALQFVTDKLAWRGYEFSDFWFIVWKPKVFLNSWEEVLEFSAAALFAFGAADFSAPTAAACPIRRKWLLGASGFTAAVIIILISFGWRDGKTDFVKIADLKDGLFHADDLFFYSAWGVIAANESRFDLAGEYNGPGVFVLRNDKLTRLPDPRRQLRDIDSVAANTEAIYASDSAQGKIFRYTNAGGWDALSSAKNFPRHPEGLFVDEDGLVTVVDESDNSITQIFPNGQAVKETPKHLLFKAPEGIVWHPILKTFLITDDVTGVIFKYLPGRELEIFADAPDGLRSSEDVAVGKDGEVIVSDNGRREIIIFSTEGRELKRIRFPLLYRDLQGVAVDAAGAIFAITANGFDNSSFISSRLWKIPD